MLIPQPTTFRNLTMTEKNDIKNTALANWLAAAPPWLKNLLCEKADTSESMFRQWVSGRRKLSADKAGVVEEAMQDLYKTYAEAPKALTRADLCDACRKCPYFEAAHEAAVECEKLDILNK